MIKFFQKLTFAFFILTSFSLFLTFGIFYFISKNYFQQLSLSSLEVSANTLAASIENLILQAKNNVLVLSQNPILISKEIPKEKKKEELDKISQFYPLFNDITLVDKEGIVIASSKYRYYGHWKTNFWFQKAKKEKKMIISDIYATTVKREPILAFFNPILNKKGEIDFFVVTQFNLEYLLNLFKSSDKEKVFLINSFGDVILSPQKELLFEKISPNCPLKENELLKKGFFKFDFQKEKMMAAFLVFEKFEDLEVPKWQLVVAKKEKEVFLPLKEMEKQFFFVILGSILFTVLSSFFFSRQLTLPLREFIFAVEKITKGNFDVLVKVKSKDEFFQLAQVFNQMVERIKTHQEELKEAKLVWEIRAKAGKRGLEELVKSLDEMVKEKTRELQEKVEELEKSRVALLNILEDVEQARKKAEEEREKTTAIIENLADGLLVLDAKEKILLVNPLAEKYLGQKREELLEKKIEDLLEIPFFQKLFSLFKEKPMLYREEIEISENLILEVTSVPLIFEKTKIGQIIILHDITREKFVEKLKTEFVSLAAHQLRTPLSGIKWALSMALEPELSEEEKKHLLKRSLEANERLIRLVNDLLDVTRIEEGRYIFKPVETDFMKLVNEVVESYSQKAKEKNLNVKTFFPEKEILIFADPEKIKIAIQNLVENAIFYTPAGKEIEIGVKLKEKELEFFVKDQGIGIPEKEKERVFTKFYRSQQAMKIDTEGSGLGLFITKNIVEAHEGKIWFESEEGKGSCFHFTLPLKVKK